MSDVFDAVIVGSGFGGSINALRLAEAGPLGAGARARPAPCECRLFGYRLRLPAFDDAARPRE